MQNKQEETPMKCKPLKEMHNVDKETLNSHKETQKY